MVLDSIILLSAPVYFGLMGSLKQLSNCSFYFLKILTGMWGQSACNICHPIDLQGWFGWSVWLGNILFYHSMCAPPKAAHLVGENNFPWIEQDLSLFKGIQVNVLCCLNCQTRFQGSKSFFGVLIEIMS